MWLVTRPEKIPPTPHCMVKSVEVIDGKGVASALLRQRVRILLDVKEIKEVGELGGRIGGADRCVGAGHGKP